MENQIMKSKESDLSKKGLWFGKIETKEDALKTIKNSSNGFYLLAALQIFVGYFILGIPMILDGMIYAVLSFFLRQYKSIVASVFLVLVSVGAFVVTAINQFSGGLGGKNTFLAIVMVWASIRALQATVKLYKLEK